MKTKRRKKYNKKSYNKKSLRKKYLKRGGGPHNSCDEEAIEELKDIIYQQLLNDVNLYSELESLYEKKDSIDSYYADDKTFTKTIVLPSNMENIKIKIVVLIRVSDSYLPTENYILKTQIIFYDNNNNVLHEIIYKPDMYYENVFYDDVINRLANILITTYHECQPKSKSKSQVKNEILEAISSEPNFYKILDVSKTANHSALKKAYYKISLICHPDKHPDNVEKAAEIFKKVSDAYITLSDPEKRKIYDSINHNIIENEEAKEESEIRIKRKIMETAALQERKKIEAEKRKKTAAREAEKEAAREAEEKAAREAEEKAARAKKKAAREAEKKAAREAEKKAAREAMEKKLERMAKNKERKTAIMKTVKDFLLPTRMFTRTRKKDISQPPSSHPPPNRYAHRSNSSVRVYL